MKENQNTNGGPEGLPLVGIGSLEDHRKECRRAALIPSDFMIIFRLENACAAANYASARRAIVLSLWPPPRRGRLKGGKKAA
jgi:hypothetical protein